ncbi:hypothetical protein GCM10025868_36000 [Angustibacter aerolatus]|uniref:Sporulation stage II protein D amidase enhancer LytB N-terminal domain-containing protein n=1 Tax=Angustibacter aerolatus TaxID=1162965 RepID=A0ABQ6JJC8_9ACTN|nr:hypothetical protein [Angustibacter aerolatus]GMA88350.1 hypothetical protein GCM10025868_36000 [Angustibacter aerolatus]
MPAVQARRARGARRAAAALVTTVALVATVTADAPAAVPPGPVHTVAASRVLDVAGRGWGHGRGLSQYGAYGAATLGRSATQILDFYYPGTAQTQQGNPTMRVQPALAGRGRRRPDRRRQPRHAEPSSTSARRRRGRAPARRPPAGGWSPRAPR